MITKLDTCKVREWKNDRSWKDINISLWFTSGYWREVWSLKGLSNSPKKPPESTLLGIHRGFCSFLLILVSLKQQRQLKALLSPSLHIAQLESPIGHCRVFFLCVCTYMVCMYVLCMYMLGEGVHSWRILKKVSAVLIFYSLLYSLETGFLTDQYLIIERFQTSRKDFIFTTLLLNLNIKLFVCFSALATLIHHLDIGLVGLGWNA